MHVSRISNNMQVTISYHFVNYCDGFEKWGDLGVTYSLSEALFKVNFRILLSVTNINVCIFWDTILDLGTYLVTPLSDHGECHFLSFI